MMGIDFSQNAPITSGIFKITYRMMRINQRKNIAFLEDIGTSLPGSHETRHVTPKANTTSLRLIM